MHFTVALLSSLPILAAAAPTSFEARTPSPIFTLIAARSASPVHLQTVNANGRAFWIGKSTASYCPQPPVTHCPAGTSTTLIAGHGAASLGKLSVCHCSTLNPWHLLISSIFLSVLDLLHDDLSSEADLYIQPSKSQEANKYTSALMEPSATLPLTPALCLLDQPQSVSSIRPVIGLASSPSSVKELRVSLLAQVPTAQLRTKSLPILRVWRMRTSRASVLMTVWASMRWLKQQRSMGLGSISSG